MDASSVTPGPDGLKALSHPLRLRILGLLRSDGPATATTLAGRLGLNTGATSYHLRQLERHGFVVDDPTLGNGRDRWWRAAHRATHTEVAPDAAPEEQETLDAYLQSVVMLYAQSLQRSVEERALLPYEWRDATTYSDWIVRLGPQQAKRVVETLMETLASLEDEPEDTEGAEPFVLQLAAFPLPGRLGGYAEQGSTAGDQR
jgi:predicted ArsR family transcriptional regulator